MNLGLDFTSGDYQGQTFPESNDFGSTGKESSDFEALMDQITNDAIAASAQQFTQGGEELKRLAQLRQGNSSNQATNQNIEQSPEQTEEAVKIQQNDQKSKEKTQKVFDRTCCCNLF